MATTDALGLGGRAPTTSARRWRLSSIPPESPYYWVRLLMANGTVVASLGFIAVISLLLSLIHI